ncbi:EF-hand calcium-binding domain-containing protein 13 [Microtus ochrogaster]|uniref:EF-hand calcium-binding domain-containing protein 13 n=1 Tax=Microtus ochrogaster TaxID=79684 RepID=A0ABM1TTB6_MICOH|nr:EF-hand calcium-binding domain-containing protein 13 [Microtus ochrogaster]
MITGSKVNVNGVDNILKNIGIEFTPKERWKLLKTLPVTSAGTVYRNRLLDGVKTFHRGKGCINKLETIMENLNYNVGEKDMKGLRSFLISDGTGRFSLSSLMNAANLFSGGKIEVEDIQPYLESLGIELTDNESQMIKSIVPVDDDNMVYQNVLMDVLRTHRSGKVSLDKIDDALEQLGYPLEEEEIEELSKHLPVNQERTVRMDLLLEEVGMVLVPKPKSSLDQKEVTFLPPS